MRKILLSAIALLMTATLLAAGTGDGSSQANAIDFDWEKGNIHQASPKALWYRVNLNPLNSVDDPTLALYLTNLTDETSAVHLKAEASVSVLGQTQSGNVDKNYSIEANDFVLWSLKSFTASGRELTLKTLMGLGLKEVYLQLQASQDVALSAKVYETEEIVDDACTKAIDFDWNGVEVPAGEQWYRLNLADVKAGYNKLKFVVANNGTAEAHVAFDMSLDCPASAVIENDWVIAAGENNEYDFGRVFLDVLDEDHVFVKLVNDQPIVLSVQEVVVEQEELDKYAGFDYQNAAQLPFEQAIALTAGQSVVYKVAKKDLIAPQNKMINLVVANKTAQEAKLLTETAFSVPVKGLMEQTVVVAANGSEVKAVKDNILKTIKSDVVYIRFTADQAMEIKFTMEDYYPCENSVFFDWNTGVKHEAGTSKWYEIDLAPVVNGNQSVKLTFTNHSNQIALVSGEIALNCPGETLAFNCPVPAGMSVDKLINANYFAASMLQHAYISITSTSDIELKSELVDVVLDPACKQAATIEKGKEINQAPGTAWYRVTDKLVDDLDLLPKFTFQNKGDQAAKITIGVTLDCDYDILTQFTLTVPTWLDLTTLLTSLPEQFIDKHINQNITEYYVKVTTSEPILFGFELDYANSFGCENAQPFDWNKGAVLPAKDAKWFEFDILPVLEKKQQVKLTFTNRGNTIAWVAAAATTDCPFTLAMPFAFAVPAGMSVDKWIDYSFFEASQVELLYIAAYSNCELELAAVAEDATVDPAITGCDKAITVEPNVLYNVLPDANNWYYFSNEPFANATSDPTFYVANKGDQRATFTFGSTVGCEYGIITKAKMIAPANADFDVTIPSWVLKMLGKLVDGDVHGFYTQISTNQPLAFKISMDIKETPDTPVVPPVDPGTTPEPVRVTEYICFGEYYYPYQGGQILVDQVIEHPVKTGEQVDSIITLVPVVAPEAMTYDLLKTNIPDALVELTRGETPSAAALAASEVHILKYYQTLDANDPTIADVSSVKWTTGVVSTTDATHTMTLTVYDACENNTPFAVEFPLPCIPATLPELSNDHIVAVCGKAINVDAAEAAIENALDADDYTAINWYVKENGEWVKLTNTAIAGGVTTVSVKVEVVATCGDALEYEFANVVVASPTPDNDPNMAEAPAISKYGNRLLVLNLTEIAKEYTIAAADVAWYELAGNQENFLGNGFYYTKEDGAPLTGKYFARITLPTTENNGCGGTMETVIIDCGNAANAAPMLVPNVVQPSEIISLMNLDPEQVAEITVYSTTGEIIAKFSAANTEEISFKAAQMAGYYIVDVQTEIEKISLRYIVK